MCNDLHMNFCFVLLGLGEKGEMEGLDKRFDALGLTSRASVKGDWQGARHDARKERSLRDSPAFSLIQNSR